MSDVLSLVTSLKTDVERLSARIDDFERRQSAQPEADAPIYGMRSIASALGLRSARTLRNWARDVDLAERHRLPLLLKRNPSGRWFTTARLIANWRRGTESNPWQIQGRIR